MAYQILISLTKILKHKIPFILIAISILISYFLVQSNELIIFFIFLVLVPIFSVFRFDGRIPFGYAVSLLIIVAILTLFKEESLADKLVIFSYWLLIVGTFCLLIELFRKKGWNNNHIGTK